MHRADTAVFTLVRALHPMFKGISYIEINPIKTLGFVEKRRGFIALIPVMTMKSNRHENRVETVREVPLCIVD